MNLLVPVATRNSGASLNYAREINLHLKSTWLDPQVLLSQKQLDGRHKDRHQSVNVVKAQGGEARLACRASTA